MTVKCMSLYLDDPCGWRRYLVVRIGRKWAHLVSLEDAAAHKCAISFLLSGRPEAMKPTRVARRLRMTAKCFGRNDSGLVKEALAALRLAGTDGVKPPTQGLEVPRSVR